MIPTVPVTVNFADQNGHPIVGGKVSATLTRDELYNGFIVPNQLTVVSDAAGVAVLDLFPNQLGSQGSQYIFRLTQPGGKTLSVTGTVRKRGLHAGKYRRDASLSRRAYRPAGGGHGDRGDGRGLKFCYRCTYLRTGCCWIGHSLRHFGNRAYVLKTAVLGVELKNRSWDCK